MECRLKPRCLLVISPSAGSCLLEAAGRANPQLDQEGAGEERGGCEPRGMGPDVSKSLMIQMNPNKGSSQFLLTPPLLISQQHPTTIEILNSPPLSSFQGSL